MPQADHGGLRDEFVGTHADHDRVDALTVSQVRSCTEPPIDIRPIGTDDDHREALREIGRLWTCPDDSPENDGLDVQATLVDVSEAQRWPRRDCSPDEILQEAVSDLRAYAGRSRRTPRIPPHGIRTVARQRRIALAVAQKISAAWEIPIQLLVAPCRLAA